MMFNLVNYIGNFVSGNINDEENRSTLENRMKLTSGRYNDIKCHSYKPHVITIKSKRLLRYLNHISNFDDKLKQLETMNDILNKVCKSIYLKYDPHLIYSFSNEINIVFFYNDNGDYMYNGNVNQILTNLVSYTTIQMTKLLQNQNINSDFVFSGKFIEFDKDYETLNYLIWRQFNCRRNTITLLYKCLHMNNILDCKKAIDKVKLEDMKCDLDNLLLTNVEFLLTGNILKKSLSYKYIGAKENESESDDTLQQIKTVSIGQFYLSENFKETLQKYIKNKII